ncbi:S phase cyclin A-associated protein in the endoplasmic reticulum-like isoform X2 [Paramacrobiotus metropolitanus]|uniref:S phase cyclin A-associated protein in the endoplasmic reticulum-like isoform X2 n=1 Tax=Paramacrobiotus metropolitanus TaxID=2943436 RepID=UPI002445A10D|nr:S phase cyclin A-associated protein in the endoplasmic reticulum-like isoform X2 [Paramacrobiotus metropolitanus]
MDADVESIQTESGTDVVATENKTPENVKSEERSEPSSRSRRRRNAKAAAKARKEAEARLGSSLSSLSFDHSQESLNLAESHSSLAPSLSTPSASTSKKGKSKNKAKRQKSDPTRLMSPLKNKCQHEEKFAKALETREQILLEKAEKVRLQSKKVEEVRQVKAAALQQIRDNISDKMQRAERIREQKITTIKIKARDEAIKVDEINFINNIKSRNRIMDVMEKEQKVVSRQQILEEERAKRYEENKARDAAVEDRRRQQELDRAAKLSEMEEKKRIKVQKVEQHVNERLQQVREKARDRALKLFAIENAQQENRKTLQEKIQKKVEISTRLHEERIELKRLRAQYLRSPRPGSADSASHLPDVETSSRYRSHTTEVSPRKDKVMKGKIEMQVEINHIAARYEKMGKKLRTKLLKRDGPVEPVIRQAKWESGDVSSAFELLECLKYATGWGSWTAQITQTLEPCLERLAKQLVSANRSKDTMMVVELKRGILRIVEQSVGIIGLCMGGDRPTNVPEKPICSVYNLLYTLLAYDAFRFLLATDVFVGLVEQAKYFSELLVFGKTNGKPKVPVAVFDSCFKALEVMFRSFEHFCRKDIPDAISERITDFIRYFMTCGILQMIGRYHTLQLHQSDGKLPYLRRNFQFTTWISRLMSARKAAVTQGDKFNADLDCCVQYELLVFRDVLKSAPVFGSVTLLYDLLRLGRSRPRCLESCQAEIPEDSYRVAVDVVRMLSCVGNADLVPLQTAFRDLTLSIQFRHICSFLIDHCLTFLEERAYLLHDVVLLIGQFAFFSPEHQDIVHAGHPPNLLQQLARFPVEYLTVRILQDILLPTLIICCYQNRKNCSILAEEMDLNHLMLYIKCCEMNLWPSRTMEDHLRVALSATPRYGKMFKDHFEEDFLRYALENRFPHSEWNAAAAFFYQSSEEDEHLLNQPEEKQQDTKEFFEEMCLLLE